MVEEYECAHVTSPTISVDEDIRRKSSKGRTLRSVQLIAWYVPPQTTF